jgi:Secretion system C-terminal sorting domain
LGSAFNLLPNPASDLVAIQYKGLLEENTTVQMYNMEGKMLLQTTINKGQTIAYFNTETLYAGTYVVRIINSKTNESHRVVVAR